MLLSLSIFNPVFNISDSNFYFLLFVNFPAYQIKAKRIFVDDGPEAPQF